MSATPMLRLEEVTSAIWPMVWTVSTLHLVNIAVSVNLDTRLTQKTLENSKLVKVKICMFIDLINV